jgi:hypothetical protein
VVNRKNPDVAGLSPHRDRDFITRRTPTNWHSAGRTATTSASSRSEPGGAAVRTDVTGWVFAGSRGSDRFERKTSAIARRLWLAVHGVAKTRSTILPRRHGNGPPLDAGRTRFPHAGRIPPVFRRHSLWLSCWQSKSER